MSVRSVSDSAATRHFPLASVLWPNRSDEFSGLLSGPVLQTARRLAERRT
ncbi:hypothetical protein [Bradyrhizobium sp. Ai1a-2]|nr:hypothetical protein [Bradyrhizobium sp. Ai1a-2]